MQYGLRGVGGFRVLSDPAWKTCVSQFFESERAVIKGMMGTVRFMAPECFKDETSKELHGKRVDIWAAGISLYLLLTNKYPFGGRTKHDVED